MRKIFLMAMVMVAFSSFVFAAPVNNVVSGKEKKDYGFKVTGEADFISERELDVSNESVEFEANFYEAKISYSVNNEINVYALLGSISDATVNEKTAGGNLYKYYFDTDFAWGLGASVLIHQFDNGLRIGADSKYRVAEVGLTDIDIDGTKYGIADISNISGNYEEWQFALGVAKEFEGKIKFTPYAGLKYSDVKVQAKGTILGTAYETDNVNSKDTFGLYAGTEVAFTDNLSMEVEGRFIDETAVSAGISLRF